MDNCPSFPLSHSHPYICEETSSHAIASPGSLRRPRATNSITRRSNDPYEQESQRFHHHLCPTDGVADAGRERKPYKRVRGFTNSLPVSPGIECTALEGGGVGTNHGYLCWTLHTLLQSEVRS